MYTFQSELWTSAAWRMVQVVFDLAVLYLTQEFLIYIDSTETESILPKELPDSTMELVKLYLQEYRSIVLIVSIIGVRLPRVFLDEFYYTWLCDFNIKICASNEYMMY